MGFPTLFQLATNALIRHREGLGDLGDAPLELLHNVLAACSPSLLGEIEDLTLQGSGRLIAPWTWVHWRALYVAAFGEPAEGPLPPLPPAAEVAAAPDGAAPGDYRLLFERAQAELEHKRAASGQRLRALREQEEAARAARHVVVVDALPAGKRRRGVPMAGRSASGSGVRGGGGGGGRLPVQHHQLGCSKERLLKKLGLGGGGGTHSRAAAPARRVTIRRVSLPGGSMPAASAAPGAAAAAAAAAQQRHASPARSPLLQSLQMSRSPPCLTSSPGASRGRPGLPGSSSRSSLQALPAGSTQQQQPMHRGHHGAQVQAAADWAGSGSPSPSPSPSPSAAAPHQQPQQSRVAAAVASKLPAMADLGCLFIKPVKQHQQLLPKQQPQQQHPCAQQQQQQQQQQQPRPDQPRPLHPEQQQQRPPQHAALQQPGQTLPALQPQRTDWGGSAVLAAGAGKQPQHPHHHSPQPAAAAGGSSRLAALPAKKAQQLHDRKAVLAQELQEVDIFEEAAQRQRHQQQNQQQKQQHQQQKHQQQQQQKQKQKQKQPVWAAQHHAAVTAGAGQKRAPAGSPTGIPLQKQAKQQQQRRLAPPPQQQHMQAAMLGVLEESDIFADL